MQDREIIPRCVICTNAWNPCRKCAGKYRMAKAELTMKERGTARYVPPGKSYKGEPHTCTIESRPEVHIKERKEIPGLVSCLVCFKKTRNANRYCNDHQE